MQRHAALSDYLTALGLQYGEPREGIMPERLTYQGMTVELDPWERTVLQDSLFGREGVERPPWGPLVAEGLAFQVKCLERLRREREGEGASDGFVDPELGPETAQVVYDLDRELDMLVTDAAVGLAIMEETQRAIDRLVVAGEMNGAKKLTAFRHKICQGVGMIKEHIGPEDFERAENKSEGMVAPTEQMVSSSSGPVPAGAWVPGRSPGKKRGARQSFETEFEYPEMPADPANRTRLLVTLLVALMTIWIVFFMPRLFQPEPVVLERAEFRHVPGVMKIEARPPSLFVTVDPVDWRGMSVEQQSALLDEVGKVAAAAGYVGADVRDTDGIVVGRWFSERGSQLVSASN
jgi:hypothetical protein